MINNVHIVRTKVQNHLPKFLYNTNARYKGMKIYKIFNKLKGKYQN